MLKKLIKKYIFKKQYIKVELLNKNEVILILTKKIFIKRTEILSYRKFLN